MISSKVKKQDEFETIVNNLELENVNDWKYLGIASILKWSIYIEAI